MYGRPQRYAPSAPCKLTISSHLFARRPLFRHVGYLRHQQQVDLLTLKVVSESRVTWATSVPILIFRGLSVLELRPMYATDRQTTKAMLNASALWGRRHNNFRWSAVDLHCPAKVRIAKTDRSCRTVLRITSAITLRLRGGEQTCLQQLRHWRE